jgi:hypothetical protein
MQRGVVRFIRLALAALSIGWCFARLAEMRSRRKMTGPEWLTTRRASADFGTVAGFTP